MTTPLAETIATALSELSTVRANLPTLVGPAHPQLGVLTGATGDVATGLFAAAQHAIDGKDAMAGAGAAVQLRALRALQTHASTLSPAPAHAATLDDSLEIVAGVLELTLP